jgi:drug/metabolite transporter (DMT)-like permease
MTEQIKSAAGRDISGWLEGLAFVSTVAVINLMYGFAARAGVHPIVFIVYSLAFAGIGLLAASGGFAGAIAVARRPPTWLVGIAIIGMEAGFFLAFTMLVAAEASVLVRLSIPLSLIAGWLLIGRRPTGLAATGGLLVLAIVAVFAVKLDGAGKTMGVLAAAAAALFNTLLTFASELHPDNRAAVGVRAKLQATGAIILATAVAALVLLAALVSVVATGLLARTALLPTPAELAHPQAIGLALAMGGLCFTTMYVMAFSATVKIGGEGFIAVGSLAPVATLLLEQTVSRLGLIPAVPFDWPMVPVLAGVVAGVLLIIIGSPSLRRP